MQGEEVNVENIKAENEKIKHNLENEPLKSTNSGNVSGGGRAILNGSNRNIAVNVSGGALLMPMV